jgi:hypothetical protein
MPATFTFEFDLSEVVRSLPPQQVLGSVRLTSRLESKVETKKAIGNGISIGCIGCPAIDAVLFGLTMADSPLESAR